MNIISDYSFKVFLTLNVAVVAGIWGTLDTLRLFRTRAEADPTGDKRFGYFVGMLVGLVGALSCLMFWDVI
jgi:hypothetical protein